MTTKVWSGGEYRLLSELVAQGKYDHEIAHAIEKKYGIVRTSQAIGQQRRRLKLDNSAATTRRGKEGVRRMKPTDAPPVSDMSRPGWMDRSEWLKKERRRMSAELLRAENAARTREAARRHIVPGDWMPGDPIL
jgi:hypothetical protein